MRRCESWDDRAGTGLASHLPYGPGMDRRHFLLTSLAGALAAPLATEAQPAGRSGGSAHASWEVVLRDASVRFNTA
jgi:hypothetical protein